MISPYLNIKRQHAIRVAEYERDSLALRQNTSQRCKHEWAEATRSADLVIHYLRLGWDSQATVQMQDLARQWAIAANCEGWPSPEGKAMYEHYQASLSGACCSSCAHGGPCATGAAQMPIASALLLGLAGITAWFLLRKESRSR